LSLKKTWIRNSKSFRKKTRIINSLVFQGRWSLDSSNVLTYIFEHSAKSRFDFRAQLESPNLYPKEGVIKYRLGIGLKKLARADKIIYLYGEWKFSRKLGLSFQMDYGEGKINQMRFTADVHLTKKNEFTFSLLNKMNEPLGINIIFTHKFMKQLDADAFLRIKRLQDELGVETGVRIPF